MNNLIEIADQIPDKPKGFTLKSPYNSLSTMGRWDSRLLLLFGMDWSGVCIAGGFAFNLACKLRPPYDIDFFFYDDHRFNLKRVAKFLTSKIEDDPATYGNMTIKKSRNVLRIQTSFGMSLDFICIKYPSIRAILDSFDLDCCRFAYTGRSIFATESGYKVYQTMSMPIDLSRATASLCHRIVKYYHRGVGIQITDPGVEHAIRNGHSFSTRGLVFIFHSACHVENLKLMRGISLIVNPGYTIQCIDPLTEYDSEFEVAQQSIFGNMDWKEFSPNCALFNPIKITEKEFWEHKPIKWSNDYYSE